MPSELPAPYLWVAADIFALNEAGEVLLIKRRNPPHGWAVPGGLVEVHESIEAASRRELLEETGLHAERVWLKGVSSDPMRDPRGRVISVIVQAEVSPQGTESAGSDAEDIGWFPFDALPADLLDEHREMIEYAKYYQGGLTPLR